MYCRNCGKENKEGQKFCNYCGRSLKQKIIEGVMTEKPDRRSEAMLERKESDCINKLLIVLIMLLSLILILTCVLIFLYVRNTSSYLSGNTVSEDVATDNEEMGKLEGEGSFVPVIISKHLEVGKHPRATNY